MALTTEQVEAFQAKGHVVIRGCFSAAAAEEYTTTIWQRLGYAPDDPSTWSEPSIHMPSHGTNPPLALAEPMLLDREPGSAEPSLVERAVLRGLGVDRYRFTPAGPREAVVPDRVARQQAMKADEERRMWTTDSR
jgi:hypothetical protein